MLLAVEGGRFFSSSASGYSKGLNLLLLGHKKEEKPMRVTPWNQYHLVDQELDPNTNSQLAANKNNHPCGCGCPSFACFGRPAASPSVGPTTSNHHHQDAANKTSSDLEGSSRKSDCIDVDDHTNGVIVNSLKSSLRKRVTEVLVIKNDNDDDDGDDEVQPVHQSDRRSVQWTDVGGGELVEIREFEPSEHSDSDDEFENSSGKTCSCRIM